MRKTIAFALGLFLFAATALAGQAIEIKLAYTPGNLDPKDSPDIMYGEVFKKEVEARTGGAIKITVYHSGQLGSAAESIQGVIGGYIEASVVDAAMLSSIFEASQVLSTPGFFESVEEADAVVNGDWGKRLTADIRKVTGIHIMSLHSKGFRNFTTSNKELKVVGDAKGVTFRVMESPVSIKMVEALGGKAVPMPGSEMYIAMRNGVVDGQENPVLNIIQDKTYEVQKYLVLDGHIASFMAYIMNGQLYDSLSIDQKKAIDEAANLAMKAAMEVVERKNREGVQVLKDYGMSVYEPTESELRDWHNAVKGPTEAYVRGTLGAAVVDDLLKAIEAYRAKR